jgi:hypothetical protein
MGLMVLVLTADSGADRLTLGRTLASELGWPLIEVNDGQPSAGTRKLRRGQARSREPSARVGRARAIIERLVDRREHAVIICSPLDDAERRTLRAGLRTVRFIQLVILAANPKRPETGSDLAADAPRSVSSDPHQPTPDGIRIGVTLDLARPKNLSSIVRRVRLEFGL